jgi:hypothetical protein
VSILGNYRSIYKVAARAHLTNRDAGDNFGIGPGTGNKAHRLQERRKRGEGGK